ELLLGLARLQHDTDPGPPGRSGPLRVRAQHGHLAAGAPAIALEDLDGRRFAGAVRAEEGEDLPPPEVEVDASHRLEAPISHPEVARLDDRLAPAILSHQRCGARGDRHAHPSRLRRIVAPAIGSVCRCAPTRSPTAGPSRSASLGAWRWRSRCSTSLWVCS